MTAMIEQIEIAHVSNLFEVLQKLTNYADRSQFTPDPMVFSRFSVCLNHSCVKQTNVFGIINIIIYTTCK